MKKFVFAFLFTFMALTGSIGQQATAASANDKNQGLTVRLGYQLNNFSFVIADKVGLLKKEFDADGISFKLLQFNNGPAQVEAFSTGNLDFGLLGDMPLITSIANNAPLIGIAGLVDATKTRGLVVRKNSGIRSVKDLPGKKIAVEPGTTSEPLLNGILEKNDIKNTELELVYIKGKDSIYAALLSGSLDGAIMTEPFIIRAEEQGYVFVDDSTKDVRTVFLVVGGTAFVKQHPDVVVRLIKVLDATNKWVADNREKAGAIVADVYKNIQKQAEGYLDKLILTTNVEQPWVDAITTTAKNLFAARVIKKNLTITDVYDPQFLNRAHGK